MLGKLIKYEFKATGKFMLLMYGLLIVMSGMIAVGLQLNLDEILSGIVSRFNIGGMILTVFIVLFAVLFAALNAIVLCGMFFYAISRFKNNLLGDEGYLMHTLPVKVRDNILAKGITSTVWTLAGFIAAAIAYSVILLGIAGTDLFKVGYNVIFMVDWANVKIGEYIPLIAELILMAITAIVNIYFVIYASMAIGFSANAHRVAKSIGVFILFKIAENIFEVLTLCPFKMFGIEIMSYMNNNVHFTLWYGIIIAVIEAIIYYFITQYFLSKKLNLQ